MMPLLYMMHEWNKNSQLPTYLFMKSARDIMTPVSGKNPFVDWLHAASSLISRTTMSFEKPEFGINFITINNENVTIKEETLIKKPFCDLLSFKRSDKNLSKEGPIVLVVAPMSGHFATLLRDTVATLLQDYDVYITDWKDAKHIPLEEGDFGLDTYIAYLLDFIHLLQKKKRPIHILAVCQPAVPVLAAVSLLSMNTKMPQPASMILMGGPIDARVNPGKVNSFAKDHGTDWIERCMISVVPNNYAGAGRKVLPGFLMLSSFMALNPDRHQDAVLRFYQHLVQGEGPASTEKHEAFYNEYRSVMDLPSTYFLDSYHHVFRHFSIPLGTFTWGQFTVDPKNIKKTALLTIEGELDDISPLGQTEAAHYLCSSIPSSKKQHYVQDKVGHYGIFNGSRWRNEIYPVIQKFIDSSS